MVTVGEFSANVMSVHKKYTGEEKAIGTWCTEIRLPKSSALRSLQTVMLTAYSGGLLFASKSHRSCIIHVSFGQRLVQKGWFYGSLGKEQWKPWIFSLTFLFSVDRIKAAAPPWYLYPRAAARPSQLPRTGFALKCQWGSPTENWKRECSIFFLSTFNPPPEPDGVG